MEIQNSGKDVICDRFLDSTIVSHKIMDKTIDTKSAEIISNSINKIQILLISSIDTIKKRLSEREIITRFEKDENLILNTQTEFLNVNNDLILSTSFDNIEKTFEKANFFINNYKK